MLQRALNILIDNAICYTPARCHIAVEVSLQTKRVTIAARDDSSEVDISAGAVCACAKQGVKWANNAGFSLKDSSCSSFKTRRAFHGSVQRQHIGIPSIPSLPSLHYFAGNFDIIHYKAIDSRIVIRICFPASTDHSYFLLISFAVYSSSG